MSIYIFMFLLTLIGGWCICDGWISLSLYIKDPNQNWYKDHYARVIRIGVGLLAWYLVFAMMPRGI